VRLFSFSMRPSSNDSVPEGWKKSHIKTLSEKKIPETQEALEKLGVAHEAFRAAQVQGDGSAGSTVDGLGFDKPVSPLTSFGELGNVLRSFFAQYKKVIPVFCA